MFSCLQGSFPLALIFELSFDLRLLFLQLPGVISQLLPPVFVFLLPTFDILQTLDVFLLLSSVFPMSSCFR